MNVAATRVAQWLKATRPQRILIACSGGADSLALAYLAAQHRAEGRTALLAAVVDHGLQERSADIAEAAHLQCQSFGIFDSVVLAVSVHDTGAGPEAAARDARRTALAQYAKKRDVSEVWLAHTLDDQAETLLIGLTHGSGARSLAGMAERDGIWARPVLSVRRTELRACLPDRVTAWEDPHNADPRLLRARVRHELLPVLTDVLGDRATLALARTAELLARDNAALDHIAAKVFSTAHVTAGQVDLPKASLEQQPTAVLTRILRHACIEVGVRSRDLTMEHLDALVRLTHDPRMSGPIALPGRVTAARAHDRLVITSAQPTPPTSLRAPNDSED